MTEKEYKVECAKGMVRDAESRLREAQKAMEEGYKKGVDTVDQAKAEHEREYGRLKEEVERAKSRLEQEKSYAKFTEAELVRGYES